MSTTPILFTIGHSTRELEEFLDLLKQNKIEKLIDIRRFPGSRKYPQYNQDNLKKSLEKNDIIYEHALGLGGRRKPHEDSKNTVWKNKSFQAYADYMETDEFAKAIAELKDEAKQITTVIMCSEAVWWRCHRSMISDYLKAQGWDVEHILSPTNIQEHPYTAPAKIVDGKLTYQK